MFGLLSDGKILELVLLLKDELIILGLTDELGIGLYDGLTLGISEDVGLELEDGFTLGLTLGIELSSDGVALGIPDGSKLGLLILLSVGITLGLVRSEEIAVGIIVGTNDGILLDGIVVVVGAVG